MKHLRWYSKLPKPNLDIKAILSNYHLYQDSIRNRELGQKALDNLEFIKSHRDRELAIINDLNGLKHQRTTLSKTITLVNRQKVLEKLSDIKTNIKELELQAANLSLEMFTKAEALPNLIDDSVDKCQQIVEYINCDSQQQFPTSDYDHKVIGERKNIIDFQSGAKVSGSSWYYLINDGAMLEQALIQYTLNIARANGYIFVIPPTLVKNEIIQGCGFKPKDQNNEQQIYLVANNDLSLIGTSEIPLAGLHVNSCIPFKNLPIKYVGLSRAFRAEAGARGKDTKGLYRVHEFTKVELFHFTKPQCSAKELNDIIDIEKQIIKGLGLKAKVINIPYNDLGAPAYKKVDIEAWMPGRQSWGELTSASNCTDYQSRRLSIKYSDELKKSHYVHTINGTAMAIPRVIVAIIEQFYDPENDRIIIPEVLRGFMGKSYI